MHELAEIQKQLLKHVSGSLKPGGKLFYSVCTIARAETDDVVSFFEGEVPGMKPWPMTNPFKPGEIKPRLLFLPQDCGGNGMFVAAWRKM